MEISQNVRRGFLGWRNERRHEVLNNALEPFPRGLCLSASRSLFLSCAPGIWSFPCLAPRRRTTDAGAPELPDRLAKSEPLYGFTTG